MNYPIRFLNKFSLKGLGKEEVCIFFFPLQSIHLNFIDKSKKKQHLLPQWNMQVTAIRWSPARTYLAVGTETGDLYLYDGQRIVTSADNSAFSPMHVWKNLVSSQKKDAIASIVWGDEEEEWRLFFASAHSVFAVDLRPTRILPKSPSEGPADVAPSPAPIVTSIDIPKVDDDDELNALAITRKGMLAAASDSGRIALLEPSSGPASKASPAPAPSSAGLQVKRTLSNGHSSIVSCLAFRRQKPTELLSGGLDCKLVRWENSSGRVQNSWGPETWSGGPGADSSGRLVMTPPFVQCLAESAAPDAAFGSLVALGLADGSITLLDVDIQSKGRQAKRAGAAKKGVAKSGPVGDRKTSLACTEQGFVCSLGPEKGGHAAGVTSVAFLGSTGRLLLSASTDRRIIVWSLGEAATPEEDGAFVEGTVLATVEGTSKVTVCAPIDAVGGSGAALFFVAVGHVRGSELCVYKVGMDEEGGNE